MNIKIMPCTDQQLATQEQSWQQEGYRLCPTAKNEKDLKPKEYLKRAYTGSKKDFGSADSKKMWELIRRD